MQQLFRFFAVGGEVGGDDVHVVAGTDSLFLLLYLHGIQVRDFSFHRLDGIHLVDGLDVHGHDEAGFHVEEIGQHPVVQLRRENLQERYRTHLMPHAEHAAVFELEGGRRDEVLDGQAGGSQPVPRKAEWLRGAHMEDVVQQPQAFRAVQGGGCYAEMFEVVENVNLNTLQAGLGCFQASRFHAEGQVLSFDEAVIAFGKLILEHFRVFRAQTVEVVALRRDGDAFHKAALRRRKVQKRKLKPDRAVEIVEEITPSIKNGRLILILVELIVDVLKLNRFRIIAVSYTADSVREHTLKRDAVLRRLLFLIGLSGPCNGGFDLTPLGAEQGPPCGRFLIFYRQSDTPPCLTDFAARARRKSYWSGKGAASVGETAPGRYCGRSFPAAGRFFHRRPSGKTAA